MIKLLNSLFLSFSIIAAALAGPFNSASAARPKFEPSKEAWEWADTRLEKMSVEEKVGQLVQVGVNARFANQDSAFFKNLKRDVVENKIGGIVFFGAPIYETTILANKLQDLADIPLLAALDAETGIGMRFGDVVNFPWAMAVGATGNIEFARRIGVITGREARAIGIRHVYAPVLDVNNNADNPVINVRSFGENPEEVAKFGVAFIEGLQSAGVLATAKHFPGHGDTNVDSHRGLPVIDKSRADLEATELLPFRRAVAAGVASVMIAHISLPQLDGEEIAPLKQFIQGDAEAGAEIVKQKVTIPATLSEKIQTGILRNDMGFKGLIVSDAMSMSGLTIYFTQEEAGVRAFLAGTDILEKPADVDAFIRGLRQAVKSGRISVQRLNESVRKLLAWKYELGLVKQKITPIDPIDSIVSGAESVALAEKVAEKAITLVRDDQNLIPMNRDAKIAVFGISNGFDGPETMNTFTRTLAQNGIKAMQVYVQENSSAEQIAAARKAVAEADLVIAALYGRVRTGAKNSVGLPENGASVLREIVGQGKNVIGISFGNPYILTGFPQMKTYMVAYGDMPSLQRAAARAVLGTQDITGRLPISLPGLYARGTGIQRGKK